MSPYHSPQWNPLERQNYVRRSAVLKTMPTTIPCTQLPAVRAVEDGFRGFSGNLGEDYLWEETFAIRSVQVPNHRRTCRRRKNLFLAMAHSQSMEGPSPSALMIEEGEEEISSLRIRQQEPGA